MNKFVTNAGAGFNIWKMAIFKVCLVAFITGFTTLQTSLNGLEWSLISPTQKFLLVGGILVSMATSIVAFLDRTMSRIESQQKALQDNDDELPPVVKNP